MQLLYAAPELGNNLSHFPPCSCLPTKAELLPRRHSILASPLYATMRGSKYVPLPADDGDESTPLSKLSGDAGGELYPLFSQ